MDCSKRCSKVGVDFEALRHHRALPPQRYALWTGSRPLVFMYTGGQLQYCRLADRVSSLCAQPRAAARASRVPSVPVITNTPSSNQAAPRPISMIIALLLQARREKRRRVEVSMRVWLSCMMVANSSEPRLGGRGPQTRWRGGRSGYSRLRPVNMAMHSSLVVCVALFNMYVLLQSVNTMILSPAFSLSQTTKLRCTHFRCAATSWCSIELRLRSRAGSALCARLAVSNVENELAETPVSSR